MSQRCNYEQSVALKAAGYDEPAAYYFMPNGNKGTMMSCYADGERKNFNKIVTCISRPSLSEAAQWLRDKMGLHVSVLSICSFDCWFYCLTLKEKSSKTEQTRFPDHDSALSAGISRALTIKQNKTE